MSLDRGHLELLRAITRHTTLAAAADAISLSPSAASRRLREAERRLGIELAVADGRTLRLTDAGQLLATTADTVLRQLADAEAAAALIATGEEPPVRIGVGFHDRITWMLPSPDQLPVEIVRLPTLRPAEAADARLADLTVDVVGAAHVVGTPLADDELVLVAAAHHPLAGRTIVTAEDLAPHRFLASDTEPQPGFELDGFLLPSGGGPHLITRVASLTALTELVARGDGVSIQPSRAVTGLSHLGLRLIPLDRPVAVVWVARATDPAAPIDHTVELLRAVAGGDVRVPGDADD